MATSRTGYARKLGALLLLLLFTEYLGSTTLFVHSHHIDGQLIVHSHPYSGTTDNPNHSHSTQQCKAISLLSFFTALAAILGLPSLAVSMPSHALAIRRASVLRLTPAVHFGLRSPPATV